MKEKCGVVGIRSFKGINVVLGVINGLRALQHRGQEAWGIAVPEKGSFIKQGLVTEGLEDAVRLISDFASPVSIGHVRYSTVGLKDLRNAQPLDVGGLFFMAHNGTISNTEELVQAIGPEFDIPASASDTQIVGLRLLQMLRKSNGDWFSAFELLNEELNGSYSFVFLTSGGDIYAARDERGFRPLCLGLLEETESLIVASESCALFTLGAKLIRDVKPGEIVKIGSTGLQSRVFSKETETACCAFEYTYFSHPSSVINGISVYEARKAVGAELAKTYPGLGEVTIPVPDSARPAALGFSKASGIPVEEGLMKDRYGKKGGLRSFIQPEIEDRFQINKWVTPIREAVRGRDVVLIDDSIVRGTSSSVIVTKLKDVGARKVSLLSTFPPIVSPCYTGIDFPTREELLAYRVSGIGARVEEYNARVAKALELDFVGYNGIKELCRGIGMKESQLCLSCTTGDYSCLRKRPETTSRMVSKV